MSNVINSFAWKFSESILSQLISLVVSIIVARILGPEAYGVVALVVIFTNLAKVLIDCGFNSALIQKKNADKLDFSSVFYFSLFFAIILYLALFIGAPAISRFYGDQYENLTSIIRVLSLTLIITSVNSVQTAYVQKKMMFRNFFWATLVGTTASGIVGIMMAYTGFGVWALVAQQLTTSVVNTLTLLFITRKMPGLMFSFRRLKEMMDFGIKVFATGLLIRGYLELRALIIGKIYSAKDLALYNRASQYPGVAVGTINSTLSAVLYPKMALEQDDHTLLKDHLRRSLRMSVYTLCPLLFGLAACAEPFVRLLLTDKWIACVPFLQIICFENLFQPLATINNQAIRAMGHSGMILKIEIVKKSLELISLLLVMKISVMAIVVNMLVMTALLQMLFMFPNRKYLGYSFREQLSDLIPGFVMGGIMMVAIYPINFISMPDIWKLLAEIVLGVALYIGMSIVTKNNEFIFIKSVLLRKTN